MAYTYNCGSNPFDKGIMLAACTSALAWIQSTRDEHRKAAIARFKTYKKFLFFGPTETRSDDDAFEKAKSVGDDDALSSIWFADRTQILATQVMATVQSTTSDQVNLTLSEFQFMAPHYDEAKKLVAGMVLNG